MLHSEILAKLPQAYETALESGDLFFFPSTIAKHNELDVEFEITLCLALQNKPALPSPHFGDANLSTDTGQAIQRDKGKESDPFAPPYNPRLHVADVKDEETHEEFAILLNKYSVVPQHFLLVTKEFKSQAAPLMPSELVQTYQLLSASKKAGRHFFAFYNCGDNSGASQPHKHIQFLPTDDEQGPPIERITRQVKLETPEKPFSITKLPYASHTIRFPPDLTTMTRGKLEETLADAFLQLLDLSISTIRHDPDYPPGSPSYNVILTLDHMHVIPRRFETHMLAETGEPLPVNALGFAGMFLVKSERELEVVKRETVGEILRSVGLRSVHDIQVSGTSQEPPII